MSSSIVPYQMARLHRNNIVIILICFLCGCQISTLEAENEHRIMCATLLYLKEAMLSLLEVLTVESNIVVEKRGFKCT